MGRPFGPSFTLSYGGVSGKLPPCGTMRSVRACLLLAAVLAAALPLPSSAAPPPPGAAAAEEMARLARLARERLDAADLDEAGALLERLLALQEKAYGRDDPRLLPALEGLDEVAMWSDEHPRMVALRTRILALRRSELGRRHPDVVRARLDLAEALRGNGEPARAAAIYEEELEDQPLGPRTPAMNDALCALAETYAALGRAADAVRVAARCAGVEEGELARPGEAAPGVGWAGAFLPVSLHMQLAPGDPTAARLALRTILRRKGGSAQEMGDSLAALRARGAPEDRALLAALAEAGARLSALASGGPRGAPLEAYQAELQRWQQERERLEARVVGAAAALLPPRRPVTIDEIQAALPEDAALVELAVYRPLHLDRARRRPMPRYAAYVLRARGEVAHADLGDANELRDLVVALRAAFAQPALDHRPAAQAAYRRIFAPIRPLLGDARRVFLGPDHSLHLLPFGALVDDAGHYLIESLSFHHVTSGRDLLRLRAPEAPPRAGPMIVADPDFDLGKAGAAPPKESARAGGDRALAMSALRFRPLSGTAQEARSLASALPAARVFTGAAATESALRAAAGPSVLHIATHGFFLPDDGLDAILGLTAPKGRQAPVPIDDALLRTGLALAGANARLAEGDDGVLTGLEAAALDLRGTRLVVLSACETAVGEVTHGGGVHGLRLALSLAGAETQVVTLWRVSDDDTAALMQGYYARLAAGEDRVEALRAEQLALVAAGQAPYFWAPFIASGRGGPLGLPKAPPAPAPAPRPAPVRGARGCACAAAGAAADGGGALQALGIAALMAIRRARSRAAARRAPGAPPPAGAGFATSARAPTRDRRPERARRSGSRP